MAKKRFPTRGQVIRAAKRLQSAKRYIAEQTGPWSTAVQAGDALSTITALSDAENRVLVGFVTGWSESWKA